MTTLRRKIMHVIDSLRTGGAEILLLNTIQELSEFDHVVVALNKPEELKDKLPAGTVYYCLRFNFKWSILNTLYRLRKIIKTEAPDVIHAHLYWSTILSRIARNRKAKFIFSIHGMMGTRLYKRKNIYRFLERQTISSSQHLVAVSNAVYEDYIKYIPFKGIGYVIHNYVPQVFFFHEKKDFTIGPVFRIVTVGSLKTLKNHETMIKALALLGEGYSLDIYGNGDMEKSLKNMAAKLKVNVSFKGSSRHIDLILPGYDLFIMSSFSEGHSIALLEAMATKLPLVLSDIPSFRETTESKALFHKAEDEKELAEKIKLMQENQLIREQVASECRSIALRSYAKEKYIGSVRALYKH